MDKRVFLEIVIWFDGIQSRLLHVSSLEKLQPPGPGTTQQTPVCAAPQKAGPGLTSAETSTGHSCHVEAPAAPTLHRRAGRQTDSRVFPGGHLVWGASRPRVDSWLDGFGPFSGKGKGHVLVGSSVGCEQRACREGVSTPSCAAAGSCHF